MSTFLLEKNFNFAKKHGVSFPKQSSQKIVTLPSKKENDLSEYMKVSSQSNVTLPSSAIKVLIEILSQMADEIVFTPFRVRTALTTQEAANLLNVSRPYLIKLLDRGEIPFHKVGTHRRIFFADLMSFKTREEKISQQALEELTRQAQELSMSY